jgi:sulfite reductase (NADPH) flavoprotein alpha-component
MTFVRTDLPYPAQVPLGLDQVRQLDALARTLTAEQLLWVSGYLAGLSQSLAQAAPSAPASTSQITILYGSETGNARALARLAHERARERGLEARLVDMADYKPRDLKEEQLLLVITSTHGEGDPPDRAAAFYEFLHGRKAPRLEKTRFAVLGLGDSTYAHFCKTGIDIDLRLADLGANRIHACGTLDVDFEDAAEVWIEAALDGAAAHAQPSSGLGRSSNAALATAFASTAFAGLAGQDAGPVAAHDRKNPFAATILDSFGLNGRGSDKATRHIELSLEGSEIRYRPGDSLGILPQNDPRLVAELIERLGLDAETLVQTPRGEVSLDAALQHDYEITTLTPGFVARYGELAGAKELQALAAAQARDELRTLMATRQIIDLIADYPATGIAAADFLGALRRLQPRLYSIASSLDANPGEVHLTVGLVEWLCRERPRHGVATGWLTHRCAIDDTAPVYVETNDGFRLPSDPAIPVIMIGAGTGVAPYRAFLQEREINGVTGRSWLFFGDRRFRTDFLYQTEWLTYLKDGVLSRMDVAFSRDQADKIYVQDRLREHGRDLYGWIEDGAHVYVCGDAKAMAPDVHEALIGIVGEARSKGREDAEIYMQKLQQDRRYLRDVY